MLTSYLRPGSASDHQQDRAIPSSEFGNYTLDVGMEMLHQTLYGLSGSISKRTNRSPFDLFSAGELIRSVGMK